MRWKRTAAIVVVLTIMLSACQSAPVPTSTPTPTQAQIYLYGEAHSVERLLDRELELWQGYYNNDDMRHLFVEYSYYTAEFLNLWMQAEDDKILDAIYADWVGTQGQTPQVKAFYQKIKDLCPETVFHGTDVGHQFRTTGKRFLKYLEESGLKDSEQYRLAQECMEQGEHYYEKNDDSYRENKMAENFVREFDKLGGESVMGIYGSAHVGLNEMNFTNTVPSMANQMREVYGDALHSKDLRSEPHRVDIITVNGKEYTASNFGTADTRKFSDRYTSREYWRLEDAYEDFSGNPKTGNVLPYNNYPMPVSAGQVFVIDYTKTDGTIERTYFRSDEGALWEGRPTTVEITAAHAAPGATGATTTGTPLEFHTFLREANMERKGALSQDAPLPTSILPTLRSFPRSM